MSLGSPVRRGPVRRTLAAVGLASAVLLTAWTASAEQTGGDFDFYVLSLSWSPTYCATDDNPDTDQCGRDRGFVVHGLWPQFEQGFPESCSSSHPRWLAQNVIDDNRDIFPSGGLAIHQWRKHGMCAGLPQKAYFDLIRAALERVTVPPPFSPGEATKRASPDTMEVLFARANDGLTEGGMSVQCRDGFFTEMRICLTRSLDFRACDEVDRDTCRSAFIAIPGVQ